MVWIGIVLLALFVGLLVGVWFLLRTPPPTDLGLDRQEEERLRGAGTSGGRLRPRRLG